MSELLEHQAADPAPAHDGFQACHFGPDGAGGRMESAEDRRPADPDMYGGHADLPQPPAEPVPGATAPSNPRDPAEQDESYPLP